MRAANVPPAEFKTALKSLESQDIHSRTADNGGRRIEKVDGGWVILNFLKYREHSETIKEQTRLRVRKFREKTTSVTLGNVTETLPSASASVSSSLDHDHDKNIGEVKKGEPNLFETFWGAYPKKVGKGAAMKAWSKIKAPTQTAVKIINALEWQRKSEQWRKENCQYIPNPATYLNQARWEDEPSQTETEAEFV